MIKYISLIYLVIGFLDLIPANAQTPPPVGRPARVLEVEKMLNREAMDFLRARFPGRPFIVNVSVDPLLRLKKGERSDGLPYYDLADEEKFDEWEDPTLSATALISRVKKISMIITVPADLSEDELTEIKSSLLPSLGMMEARDSIEVRKRTWLSSPSGDAGKLNAYHILIVGLLIGLFLLGLFGVLTFAAQKVTSGLKEVMGQRSSTANDSGPSSSANTSSTSPTDGFSKSSGGMGSSEVKMLDSLKFLEHVTMGIKLLSQHSDFPRLDDILIFENFLKKNKGEFGAFLAEMPFDLRMRIFGLSNSLDWMEALNDPTDVGNLTLEELQRCLRVQRNAKEAPWQQFLILVWRLKDRCGEFFKGIPEKEAMAILAHLPKGEGVRWAREIFPGNWGQILDVTFRPEPLDELTVKKYSKKALDILPLNDSTLLSKFKGEREILNFARFATIQAEKEIYLASGEDSNLRKIRPPFYPFYGLNTEQYKQILPKFSIEEWSLALFNTPKAERQVFESLLQPKQKARLYEYFRKLEQREAAQSQVADVRDRIGQQIESLLATESKPAESKKPESSAA
jgi:hypothetical protein